MHVYYIILIYTRSEKPSFYRYISTGLIYYDL